MKKYIKNPALVFVKLAYTGLFNWIGDELFLKMEYWCIFRRRLNLLNPNTFNEKIQWLKIHDRNPLYTTLVDKDDVKKYVSNIIGNEYIIPTIGVWDRFEEIDFESLPREFVLKATHDSGGSVIVWDKNTFDVNEAKIKLKRSLNRNYYYSGREWPYKNVHPRIIAERNIGRDDQGNLVELSDYKFFVFAGEVKFFYVTYDRGKESGTCIDVYDLCFNKLPVRWGYQNSNYEFVKPKNFSKMVNLAETLGKDFLHVRVDLYNINGRIYFGEMTFYTWSGLVPIIPEKWDYEFGQFIDLSKAYSRTGGYVEVN